MLVDGPNQDADLDGSGGAPGDMKLQPESPSTKKRRTPATQASPSIPDLVPPPPDDGLRRDDRRVQSFRRLRHVAATKPPAPATAASARYVAPAPQRLAGPDAAHRWARDAAVSSDAPEADAHVFGSARQRPGDPVRERVQLWFHRICTGLTDAAFHLLTQEVYAEWVCDRCLSSKSIPLVKFKP
ncbi:hypothetical protein MTO96_040074 [Rhipicephalus appendiculatus]